MEQILERLRKSNIKINVVQDQLKLKIPDGFDAKDILLEVRENKQSLIDFIKEIKTEVGFEAITQAEQKEYYALSSVQKRLYFLYQFDNTSMAYNLLQTVLLEGEVDKQKLEQAFGKLIERHEPLRTSFLTIDGEPVQKISDEVGFKIEHFQSKGEEADRLVNEFTRPFDLSTGPLMRVGLISRENDESNSDSQQHILMVDIHHIVADGTSLGILINDFKALYDGEELRTLGLQYKDYSEWQQSELRQKEIARQKGFWEKEFAKEVIPIKLPTEFKRPLIMSNAGVHYTFVLDADPLESLAKSEGTTLFILLLSIFNILLSKLGDTEDVVIGTPIAGRHHSDLENMIGMFVPALPLRNYPKKHLTFREFLGIVNSKIPECFDNQSCEYEEILEKLKTERDISHNPLFDYMFSLQNFEKSELSVSDLTVKPYENSQTSALFDLTLAASQMEDKIGFSISYSTELFTEEIVARFAGYFKKIVSTVIADSNIKLLAIDILPVEERLQILNEFNKPEIDYTLGGTVLDQIEKQVRINPTKKAIIFNDTFLSYEVLNTRANQLANYLLKEKSIEIEDRVGIYFDRSPATLIALLAILKSGACFIPLDPDYPAERIEKIVESSQLKFILTNISGDFKSSRSKISIVDVIAEEESINKQPLYNPEIHLKGSNLAYIIYTSGSTGIPKGVMIEHSSLLDYTTTFKDYFSISEKDKVIHQSSLTFDTSMEEVFPALMSGASLVVMPQGGRDVEAILKTIQDTQASILSTTPLVLSALNSTPDAIGSLRAIISGGDLLLPGHIDRLIESHAIYNTYGPSESTVCISYHKIDDLTKTSLIGKPINNRQVFIVSKAGHLCPIGAAGELCVSGKGLARGYLGDEQLTEEKFIDNPFVSGKRMYRTGDSAKWLSDGTIEFLGRIDAQVKIRGIRIELKEIENHLLGHEGIHEVAVLAKGEGGDKYLVAYYVSDSPLPSTSIRNYLADILPNYMIPAAYIHLDKMPVTANGAKLDKKALPEPKLIEHGSYVAAANATESLLVELWSEVLGIPQEKISVTRNFFELGGHSLKATALVNKIYKRLSVEVPLKEVFKHQDIRSLGDYIDRSSKSVYAAIPKAKEKEHYLLSSAQKRQYFLQQFDLNAVTYNIPQFIKLRADLDLDRLQAAFQGLTDRHESFRTRFVMQQEEPVQIVEKDLTFELKVHIAKNESEAATIVNNFVHPFDLTKPPLLRSEVIKVGDSHHLLMTDMHHIISDGVSMEILAREFIALYDGEKLPTLRLQYKDYAEWQQGEEAREKLNSAQNFWLEAYKEMPEVLNLPTDHTRPVIRDSAGDIFSFTVSESDTERLKKLAQAEGTTMFMLILSVFNVLLSRLSNQHDLVVGTPTAGRFHDDLAGIVGMFVNTLPLRNYPSGEKGFTAFLQEVKASTLACFEHQVYQYEDLVNELQVSRDTGRNPLFDVMCSYQNNEASEAGTTDGLETETYKSAGPGIAKFDFSLSAMETGKQLLCAFDYTTDIFDRTSIERFAGYFKKIIAAIVSDKEIKLSAIDILSAKEQFELLNEFNKPLVDYGLKGTIVDQLEKQAALTPTKTAIVFKNTEVSYEVLNTRVNQLANYLIIGKGIQTEDRVGICFDKSPAGIIALLATLKSGATFIPLDQDYPKERVEKIAESSQLKLVLTNLNETLELSRPEIAIVDILAKEEDIRNQSEQNPGLDLTGAHLAYIIYTSGSTGIPKGVMIEHSALLDYAFTFKDYFSISQKDKVIHQSSLTFDTSVEEIFPALISGAALVIMPEGGRDADAIARAIEDTEATILSTTPLVLSALNSTPHTIASLRAIISGGDLLLSGHIDRLIENHAVYNTYGPSESTVCVSYHKINELTNTSLIGKPITNRQVFVLSETGHLCPVGVAGELCVGGEGLAQGYLGDKQLTKEKFVENPFVSGGKMYRTGDLVRWLSDGTIQFLGRIDDQVKIRGVRVELREIENHLLGYENIREAVVLAKGEGGDKYLVAYYVSDSPLKSADIRNYLTDILPNYMIPAFYMHLDQLPMTANGAKLVKTALPEPEQGELNRYVSPANETEEHLVAMWSAVLKMEPEDIGVTANFFELGGHSLKATVLVNHIKKRLNTDIGLLQIFRKPTIREIADYLRSARESLSAQKGLVILNGDHSNGKKNLFFIHDGSGDIQGYLGLSETLKHDYNSWAIRSTSLQYLGPQNIDCQALAGHYVELLTGVQPKGPYHLVGWSIGGVIAHEVVAQLEQAGKEVAGLYMMDTHPPTQTSGVKAADFDLESEIKWLSGLWHDLPSDLSTATTIETLWQQMVDLINENDHLGVEARKLVPENLRAVIPHFDQLSVVELIQYINTIRTLDRSIANYCPSLSVKAPVFYYKAAESEMELSHILAYFRSSPVLWEEVPGNHFSMMTKPHVDTLGQKIAIGIK